MAYNLRFLANGIRPAGLQFLILASRLLWSAQ